MSRFKKGDRVIVVRNSENCIYKVGDTGTVDENGSVLPWVKWDVPRKGDDRWAAHENNLQLIEETTTMIPDNFNPTIPTCIDTIVCSDGVDE